MPATTATVINGFIHSSLYILGEGPKAHIIETEDSWIAFTQSERYFFWSSGVDAPTVGDVGVLLAGWSQYLEYLEGDTTTCCKAFKHIFVWPWALRISVHFF